MVNKEIKAIASRIAEELKPKAVYLFGSYARGDYNKTSDYDFYIVMPGKKRVANLVSAKANLCIYDLMTRPVDIVVNNESVFKERSGWINTLEQTVIREGVKLYGK